MELWPGLTLRALRWCFVCNLIWRGGWRIVMVILDVGERIRSGWHRGCWSRCNGILGFGVSPFADASENISVHQPKAKSDFRFGSWVVGADAEVVFQQGMMAVQRPCVVYGSDDGDVQCGLRGGGGGGLWISFQSELGLSSVVVECGSRDGSIGLKNVVVQPERGSFDRSVGGVDDDTGVELVGIGVAVVEVSDFG